MDFFDFMLPLAQGTKDAAVSVPSDIPQWMWLILAAMGSAIVGMAAYIKVLHNRNTEILGAQPDLIQKAIEDANKELIADKDKLERRNGELHEKLERAHEDAQIRFDKERAEQRERFEKEKAAIVAEKNQILEGWNKSKSDYGAEIRDWRDKERDAVLAHQKFAAEQRVESVRRDAELEARTRDFERLVEKQAEALKAAVDRIQINTDAVDDLQDLKQAAGELLSLKETLESLGLKIDDIVSFKDTLKLVKAGIDRQRKKKEGG